MRVICHDRSFLTRSTYMTLIAFLIWSMASVVPPTVLATELPLGLATGSKEAQLAIDGKQWAPLPGSSNPVYEGTMIRTGKGAASVVLKDGTQLELGPRTFIGLSGSRTAPAVKIAVGRVLFRLTASSRAAFVTPTVRYQTKAGNLEEGAPLVRVKASSPSLVEPVGEIAVNSHGGARIGLQQGEILAKSVSDPGLHLVKAGQSVYIPQVGAPDPSFSPMLAQALPGDATGGAVTTGTAGTEAGLEGTAVAGSTGGGIGTGTIVGLGVAAAVVGGGIAAGVAFSGSASPSTP